MTRCSLCLSELEDTPNAIGDYEPVFTREKVEGLLVALVSIAREDGLRDFKDGDYRGERFPANVARTALEKFWRGK